ncbi:MAG: chemotaxis protein CheW [Cocleimonas sp.]|nr:chemotaxis protein CheW [Cocleimonas sp.]
MHTVEKNNVAEKSNVKLESTEASSYTSILNSAIHSTKLTNKRDRINRFFYTVGEHNFLFEQDLKVENLPLTTANKVPHAPDWCIGIISVRGIIMPIVDMHKILESEFKKTKNKKNINNKEQHKSHFIMIEHKQHAPIILQIDKLPETVNIKDFTYAKPLKSLPDWIERTWKNSKNKLFEVNHNELFKIIKLANN